METRGRKKNPAQTAATRNNLIEKSYALFSSNTIESVTMSEIAKAQEVTITPADLTDYSQSSSEPVKNKNEDGTYTITITGKDKNFTGTVSGTAKQQQKKDSFNAA